MKWKVMIFMQGRFCSKCGTQVGINEKYCPKCGAVLSTNNNEVSDDIRKAVNSDFVQMMKRDYFSYQGRLNRKPYFWRSLLIIFLETICYVIFDSVWEDDLFSTVLLLISIMIFILCIIADLMLDIRRLHDVNKSGWFVLLTFIPAVTPFFYLYLFLMPGTDGNNQYGENPLNFK